MEELQALNYQGGAIQAHDCRTKNIAVSEDGKAVAEAEYWAEYYEHPDFSYEWNNGYLEEIPVSDHKNLKMYAWFATLADVYLQQHPVAEKTITGFGFRLALPGGTKVRKPDMAFVLNSNSAALEDDDRSFSGTFDLCVELISDAAKEDIERDTKEKKEEYETAGIREYFILDFSGTHMAFYRRNKRGQYTKIRRIGGDVIRSQVLPGFQFRISDLKHRRPSLEEMAEDEVYQEFVMPYYRKERERADKAEKLLALERQAKEQEKQRADEAEKRAERLAAMLREAGISFDEEQRRSPKS
jgi:Uma2 family endonuclease